MSIKFSLNKVTSQMEADAFVPRGGGKEESKYQGLVDLAHDLTVTNPPTWAEVTLDVNGDDWDKVVQGVHAALYKSAEGQQWRISVRKHAKKPNTLLIARLWRD